jgi:hypothetical protein
MLSKANPQGEAHPLPCDEMFLPPLIFSPPPLIYMVKRGVLKRAPHVLEGVARAASLGEPLGSP